MHSCITRRLLSGWNYTLLLKLNRNNINIHATKIKEPKERRIKMIEGEREAKKRGFKNVRKSKSLEN